MGRFGILDVLRFPGIICLLAILAIWQVHGPAWAGSGDRYSVDAGLAALHETPDDTSRTVAHLEKGRKVVALRETDGWVKVLAFGKGETGWVSKSHLKEEAPAGRFAAQPQASPQAQERQPRYSLFVRGQRQEYRARCKTVTEEGDRRRSIFEGRTPSRILFHDRAVFCRVDLLSQHGSGLTVTLVERGVALPLGRNATQGYPGCVAVRSDGPWGNAYGRRCTRAVFSERLHP